MAYDTGEGFASSVGNALRRFALDLARGSWTEITRYTILENGTAEVQATEGEPRIAALINCESPEDQKAVCEVLETAGIEVAPHDSSNGVVILYSDIERVTEAIHKALDAEIKQVADRPDMREEVMQAQHIFELQRESQQPTQQQAIPAPEI